MRVQRFMRHVRTVARREFMTAVTQPTFLIFLLSPLVIVLISAVSGIAMDTARTQSMSDRQVVMLAEGRTAEMARSVDARFRSIMEGEGRAELRIERPSDDPLLQARALLAEGGSHVVAVLYGRLDRPTILRARDARADARYLAQIADQTVRSARMMDIAGTGTEVDGISHVTVNVNRSGVGTPAMAEGLGAVSIVLVFIATYLLSSHIATGFSEERSSKIVEILASSASLESVFFGKLLGELAIATLFTAFWACILAMVAMSGMLPVRDDAVGTMAASGAAFPFLFTAYFILSYLISSCSILGLASLASTPRGAAIITMPFSVMQFGMMSLATYVAMQPGTPAYWLALAIPYSSPLVMVSRAAMSPSLGIHLLAIAWQVAWVFVIVRLAARAFRRGALGGAGR